ncbi:MAG: hypothetical protein J6Q15_02420 [Clostridia bacterium]|nr:hypothetical protein [Clostridia bacterium]
MNIEPTKVKIKCSVSGCDNYSSYTIVNKKFVFDGNFYLCSGCLRELYSMIGGVLTPKSPTPIYKKRSKDET